MAKIKLLALSLAVFLVSQTPMSAWAQRYQPFGTVDIANYDLTPFAPVEIDGFGGEVPANTGFFSSYDRLHMNVSRSSTANAPFEGDWAWGNRFDFGYMTDDDHGWLVEIMNIDGPNVRMNPTSMTDLPPGPVENVMNLKSFELSKQWRWKPLHHGSIVECFIGARYVTLQSQDNRLYNIPGLGPFQGVAIENNMYGAQAGLRWYKKKGRMTFSAEGRYFYGYNDQFFGNGLDTTQPPIRYRSQEWIHAGDARVELTCDITKSFALAVGWEMLYFGNGVARGAGPFNDQDVLAMGFTLGFSMNR